MDNEIEEAKKGLHSQFYYGFAFAVVGTVLARGTFDNWAILWLAVALGALGIARLRHQAEAAADALRHCHLHLITLRGVEEATQPARSRFQRRANHGRLANPTAHPSRIR